MMGIKHSVTKRSREKLFASEWNADHKVDGDINIAAGTSVSIGTTDNNDLGLKTNNTKRINIKANGYVGIGTVDPQVTLDIKGYNVPYGGLVRLQAPDYAGFTFYNSNNPTIGTANRLGDILYDISAKNLRIVNWNGGSYGNILLNPYGGNVGIGTTSPSQRFSVLNNFVVTSDGKVGVGTATPDRAFHIRSSSSAWKMENPNTGGGYWLIGQSSDDWVIGGGKLVFIPDSTNSTDAKVVFTNSGNVGIGTTSPTTTLDINSNKIRIRSSYTPSSSSAAGNTGEICFDSNYIYVCVATNTWKRVALSSW